MKARYQVNVRHKAEFLRRIMMELAGDSRISFEGDLSHCHVKSELIVAREETSILRRNTLQPVQDFMVVRLHPEDVEAVFKDAVMAIGLKHAILHTQVERGGVLEFAAYDNFRHVVTGPAITSEFLEEMRSTGTVSDFKAVVEVHS